MGAWIYRIFFKATLNHLELILFIDRMSRKGHDYNYAAARYYLDTHVREQEKSQ